MRRLTLLLLLFSSITFGQVVKHHSYTTYFNADLKEPDSCVWVLNKAMLSCGKVKRKNVFHSDPQIPGSNIVGDYLNSHYDKGHLFSFQDAECDSTDRIECFFMSNMVPQLHVLNGITWYALESYCRAEALKQDITIVAGGYGSLGVIGKDRVNVPRYCWKKIVYRDSTSYWIMPNVDTVARHDYDYYKLTKKQFFNLVKHY